MKKISLLLLVVLALIGTVGAETEPAVMFSLSSPAFLFAESGNPGMYELSSLYDNEAILFALPAEVISSELSFSDMISGNVIEMGDAMLGLVLLYSGFENSEVLSGDGSVSFAPDVDIENGMVSLDISYENISLLYRFGARVENTTLDGDLSLITSFFEPSLFSAYIKTDGILINGDSSYSGKEVEIRIDANSEVMDSYLKYMGIDKTSARELVASAFAETPFASSLGLDTPEAVLAFAESNNALDIVDTAAFIYAASSDSSLDEMDIFSMIVIPSLYIDGELSEDIDLEKVMRWSLDFMNFADSL